MSRRKKHRKGEGYLEKLPNGEYLARWEVNGKRMSKATHTTDRDTAERELARCTLVYRASSTKEKLTILKAQAELGMERIEDEKQKLYDFELSELEQKYLSHPNCPDMAEQTKVQLHYDLKYFIDFCATKYVHTIQHVDKDVANAFMIHLQATKSPSSYNQILRSLRKVINCIAEAYHIKENHFDGTYKIKQYEKTDKENLTKDEMERLLKYLETADIETRVFWFLGIYTGMRRSDCQIIKWSNIDLENKRLVYKPHKTLKYGTIARVTLVPQLVELLSQIKRLPEDNPYYDYVLPGYAKISKDGVKCRVRTVFERCQIETKNDKGKTYKGFHSLRHGFITFMLDQGTPISTIADMVGHRKTNAFEMTLGYHNSDIEDFSTINKAISQLSFENKENQSLEKISTSSEVQLLRAENIKLKKENEQLKAKLAMIQNMFA